MRIFGDKNPNEIQEHYMTISDLEVTDLKQALGIDFPISFVHFEESEKKVEYKILFIFKMQKVVSWDIT